MTIKEILNTTHHRLWSIPIGAWKFYQEWNNALFLHWQVDYNELKKYIPKEIEIDLFEGKPWVSLVAFTMEKVRSRFLPSFKPISNFHEINIRTYVKLNNKAGVYFLSIEGGTKMSCQLAKAISELPYRYSKMNRVVHKFESCNAAFGDNFAVQFLPVEEINDKTELDKWLTERYALFQDANQFINEFEIHHLEWPIRKIKVEQLEVNYPRFKNLINNNPDLMHCSNGVQVLAWGKKKNRKNP